MKDIYQLERNVLSMLIADETARDQVRFLSEHDFLDVKHKKIISTLNALSESDEEIDYMSVHGKSGVPISYVAGLSEDYITSVNVENAVRALKNKATKRVLREKLGEVIRNLEAGETDSQEIITTALKELENIQPENRSDETSNLKQAMSSTIELIERRAQSKDDKSLYTGMKFLDYFTAGLHEQEVTTIAARPGAGKSVMAMQIGLNIARNKRKVMFVNLEMSEEQICQRIISAHANIDGNKLRKGDLESHEWKQTIEAASRNSMENFIFDKTSKKPGDIKAKIRKLKPDVVIIDYLQLLQADEKHDGRTQAVASITRAIKLMSLEYNIPIIMLSQLNREAEGQRPTFANLRESGTIEQDSDNIIFIHRMTPDELEAQVTKGNISYGFIADMDSAGNTITNVILEKQRNGQTGDFPMILVPKLMKFIGFDKED